MAAAISLTAFTCWRATAPRRYGDLRYLSLDTKAEQSGDADREIATGGGAWLWSATERGRSGSMLAALDQAPRAKTGAGVGRAD